MPDLTSTTPAAPPTPPKDPSGQRFMAAVDRLLYPATVGFTLVILGFVFYEFSQGGRYQLRLPFGDVYLVLLTSYAAQREGSKWFGADEATTTDRRAEVLQLVDARRSVSAEDVVEALTIPKTSAWRILETLEKEGVLRQDDSSDSRNRRYRRSS